MNNGLGYLNLSCSYCVPLGVHLKGAEEMRKVSIRTVEVTIGLARSMANGTTKWPFLGYCADMMEKMLEEIKEARKK
jgi:hypothetical protein